VGMALVHVSLIEIYKRIQYLPGPFYAEHLVVSIELSFFSSLPFPASASRVVVLFPNFFLDVFTAVASLNVQLTRDKTKT
jgi:hypothetical protein